jgi:hypothetical protein
MGGNEIMFQDFLDWLNDNWLRFIISILIVLLAIFLIISIIPASFKSGYVIKKTYEEEKQWNTEEEEQQYRTEYYQDTDSYRDSDGNSRTKTVTKSRRVYDHTDIVSYHYVDDEDFIILVKSNDNKAGYNFWQIKFQKDRELKNFIFYIEKSTYEELGIEREFVKKEIKHWTNDNITKTETSRRRKGLWL